MNSYAPEELLASAISRLIGDAAHVAVGAASPIPASACELLRAKSGGRPRLSLMHQRKANPYTEGSRELFDLAGQGRVDVFFLGGAQIDGAANINLVRADGKRFPGSFGSAYLYPIVPRVILFREEHSARVLVKRVDFISASGNPAALVTGKALFAWQRDKRRFRLESVHPGSSADEVRQLTGFDFDSAKDTPATAPPSAQELAQLRSSVKAQVETDYPEFARRVWG